MAIFAAVVVKGTVPFTRSCCRSISKSVCNRGRSPLRGGDRKYDRELNGAAVQQIGQQFGLSDDQANSAIAALAAGLPRNMANPQGLDGLLGALVGGSHQRYVDDPSSLGDAGTVADGNNILGHILGSTDVSRQLASQASAQTGVGESALNAMLPIVAAMVMGSMSKRVAAQPSGMSLSGGGATDLLSMLTPVLDSNRDGSVVNDVAGMVGKLFSGR